MKSFREFREAIDESMIIESFLDEMANLYPDDTGVPCVIWIGTVGGQHGPRVKVSNTRGSMNADSCFVMSISKNPLMLTPRSCKLKKHEIENVADWIRLNYDVLMKLWKLHETGDGSAIILMNQLKKI